MRVEDISAVIRNATHEDLVGARNDAYMQLYTANFKLNGNLESLEKAYNTIACGVDKMHKANPISVDRTYHSSKEEPEVTDLISLDVDDYPAVRYWYRHQYQDEK